MTSVVPSFVGLDYHGKRIQVCVVCREPERGGGQGGKPPDKEQAGMGHARPRVLLNKGVPATAEAVIDAVRGVPGGLVAVRQVGIEACSGTAVFAEQLAALTKWEVVLANATTVSRMKPTIDKTDRSDARVIAELSCAGYLPRVWLAPQYIRQLRQLVGLRRQHVEAGKKTKLRILALLRELRIPDPDRISRWTRAYQRWLERLPNMPEHSRWILDQLLQELGRQSSSIKAVEERLRQATREDPVVQALLELPGVGPVTAWMLRAVVGDFARFGNGRQLARYCGLTPLNVSSGDKVADAGVVRSGDGALKAVLVQAAHRLARFEQRWRNMYLGLKEQGKPTNVAVVAVANRWVRWLFYQVRDLPDPLARAVTAGVASAA